jgi:hypothetical protein
MVTWFLSTEAGSVITLPWKLTETLTDYRNGARTYPISLELGRLMASSLTLSATYTMQC